MKEKQLFMSKKILFIVGLVCSQLVVFAQIGKDKWNITTELSLPSGRTNAAFNNYMKGLVNVNPKIQFKPTKHFYVALAPKYMYYSVASYKIPDKMNGGMHVAGGNIELGYTTWRTNYFGMEFGLKAGFAEAIFVTDKTKITGIERRYFNYLEPTVSFILAADEAVAYRWIIGYQFSTLQFHPNDIGLETLGGFTPQQLSRTTNSFLIGFGLSYYFGNPRSDNYIDE